MKKKILCILIVVVFCLMNIPIVMYAAENITINEFGIRNPGDNVIISGKTVLDRISIVVYRPDGTLLDLDSVESSSGTYSYTFTLPMDTPEGKYMVKAGKGEIVASRNFNVAHLQSPESAAPVTPEKPQIRVDENTGKVTVEIEASFDAATAVASIEVEQDIITEALDKARADENGIKNVAIEIPAVEGAKAYNAQIPAGVVTSEVHANSFEIKTEIATLVVPSNMIKASEAGNAVSVDITIAAVNKEAIPAEVKAAIGDRPVIELNIKVDGKLIIWNNPDAPVMVSIPYKPTPEELKNPEHIVVWYIDGQGNAVSVPSGKYNPETGMVTFYTTHFSKYAVNYVVKTFGDIGKFPWAKKEIEVLSSKGIINGISSTKYGPDAKITRADFLVLLMRALGLVSKLEMNFSDVHEGDYFYEAVSTARSLGITNGIGNNLFDPGAEISRQDMMTLAARAMRIAGKLKTAGSIKDIERFGDRNLVTGYAVESIGAMVKEGVVKGDGTNLNPLGIVTRAEAAVIIYRIYNAS